VISKTLAGVTQTEAAQRTGLSQPDISKIAHGRGTAFSKDRLIDVLAKLGVDVEITLHHGTGRVTVRELVQRRTSMSPFRHS
jgi:transcriptional regulator with XRE-family HTH domain